MKSNLRKEIYKNRYRYLMLLPAILFYAAFCYAPMYGVVLAFKEYKYSLGIMGSPWVGLQNFRDIMMDPDFRSAFRNTLLISFGRLIFEFPIPILVALMMNEINSRRLKKAYQVVFTFPHFFSWIVVSSILFNFLSDSGMVNQFLNAIGIDKINFLSNPSTFRAMVFISDSWKEMGYSAIIYMATIAGISPELYEAAYVDGAGRFKQMLHITLPSMKSVILILFILQVGSAMNGGFDQIYNMYNPVVYPVGDIIDTYIYRRTFILGSSFGTSTAVGLLKSVINFVLLLSANQISSKLGGESLI